MLRVPDTVSVRFVDDGVVVLVVFVEFGVVVPLTGDVFVFELVFGCGLLFPFVILFGNVNLRELLLLLLLILLLFDICEFFKLAAAFIVYNWANC